MKTKTRSRLAALVCLLVLAAALFYATRVLTPKRHDYGSTWGQFLKEEKNSTDVMFFGSSLVYCDVAPAAIWTESGLRSYVMAGAEQTVPMTYYYLREALKTQSPKAVFVEATGMIYDRYTNYTQVNIGYMPWGGNRLKASLTEAEDGLLPGFFFPLWFYHSRWNELTADDWRVGLTGYRADDLAGYTFLHEYRSMSGPKTRRFTPDADNWARNLEFLKKIASLCADRGIQVVFYLAPSMGRLPQETVDSLKDAVAGMDGARFLDCNGIYDSFGIDASRDYFDTLHFNVSGAEKFSRVMADWITENLGLSPSPDADAALWDKRAAYLRAQAAQPLTPRKETAE